VPRLWFARALDRSSPTSYFVASCHQNTSRANFPPHHRTTPGWVWRRAHAFLNVEGTPCAASAAADTARAVLAALGDALHLITRFHRTLRGRRTAER